jgi:hypothetical protein
MSQTATNNQNIRMRRIALITTVLLFALPTISLGQALTDQQIADWIIQESQAAYYATGHLSE